MTVLIIVVIVLVVLGAIIAVVFNRLVQARTGCLEAWSNVETELKRRYELIPNLVNTVRGYMKHEADLLTKLSELRERAASNDGSVASQAKDESQLQVALRGVVARFEAYPDLNADTSFLELQSQLANTEDRIQASLRLYNGNVRDNNNLVQQFPSNMVAGIFGFQDHEFFELVDDAARGPVDVSL